MLTISNIQMDALGRAAMDRYLCKLHAHHQRVRLIGNDVSYSARSSALRDEVRAAQALGFRHEFEIMLVVDLFLVFGRLPVEQQAAAHVRSGHSDKKNLQRLLRELNYEPNASL